MSYICIVLYVSYSFSHRRMFCKKIEELLKKTFKNLLFKKNVINVLIILKVFYLRKEILVTMIHIVT